MIWLRDRGHQVRQDCSELAACLCLVVREELKHVRCVVHFKTIGLASPLIAASSTRRTMIVRVIPESYFDGAQGLSLFRIQ